MYRSLILKEYNAINDRVVALEALEAKTYRRISLAKDFVRYSLRISLGSLAVLILFTIFSSPYNVFLFLCSVGFVVSSIVFAVSYKLKLYFYHILTNIKINLPSAKMELLKFRIEQDL